MATGRIKGTIEDMEGRYQRIWQTGAHTHPLGYIGPISILYRASVVPPGDSIWTQHTTPKGKGRAVSLDFVATCSDVITIIVL